MFSEHTAPIGTYDIPIDSDFHGDGPCQIWAPGIDRVFSSMEYEECQNTFKKNLHPILLSSIHTTIDKGEGLKIIENL